MLSYNSTIASHPEGTASPYLSHRWKALSLALQSFTSASKLPETELSPLFNLPKIHLKRGDCEVLRFQLGQSDGRGEVYEPAVTNAPVLLKNAAKFYAGAEANARHLAGLDDEVSEAVFKGAMVKGLQGDGTNMRSLLNSGMDMDGAGGGVGRFIDEVMQEGLVNSDQFGMMERGETS
jgi:hypothetical protein